MLSRGALEQSVAFGYNVLLQYHLNQLKGILILVCWTTADTSDEFASLCSLDAMSALQFVLRVTLL